MKMLKKLLETKGIFNELNVLNQVAKSKEKQEL